MTRSNWSAARRECRQVSRRAGPCRPARQRDEKDRASSGHRTSTRLRRRIPGRRRWSGDAAPLPSHLSLCDCRRSEGPSPRRVRPRGPSAIRWLKKSRPALSISIGVASSPMPRAVATTSRISSIAPGAPPLAITASLASRGVASRNNSIRLPAVSVCWIDIPVILPPGRARLSTTPAPTGSIWAANTTGIVVVVRFTARTGAEAQVTMTSTLRPASSAAISP